MGRVRYPGLDDMIAEDDVENLEMRMDGTLPWDPTPPWAKLEGRRSITVDELM